VKVSLEAFTENVAALKIRDPGESRFAQVIGGEAQQFASRAFEANPVLEFLHVRFRLRLLRPPWNDETLSFRVSRRGIDVSKPEVFQNERVGLAAEKSSDHLEEFDRIFEFLSSH
jgi:hypothetical protein